MKTSRNGSSSSGGCFSGLLRVLLCKGKLQTHPADETPDFNKTTTCECELPEIHMKGGAAVAAPGVVARLMGLDAMPLNSFYMRKTTLEQHVLRSRSVNFMDYLLELDHQDELLHRRVKSSVSFREVPELLHRGDRNLLVLYLKDQESAITSNLNNPTKDSSLKEEDKVKTGKLRNGSRSSQRSANDKEFEEESGFMRKVRKKTKQQKPINKSENCRRHCFSDEAASLCEAKKARNGVEGEETRMMTKGGEEAEWGGVEEICGELARMLLEKLVVKIVEELALL